MKAQKLLINYFITALIILVTTHLSMPVYFPLHQDYLFPWRHYAMTLVGAIIILHIVEAVYYLFERFVFRNKVNVNQIVTFILAALITIAVYYSTLYPFVLSILNAPLDLYSFMISLSATLVLVALLIFVVYGKKFVELLTVNSVKGNLKVKSGKNIHLIPLHEILCFFSHHKTVFLINDQGQKVLTNFTLNELEGLLDRKIFFRANRQYLLQHSAVSSVIPVANDKLDVVLKNVLKLDSPIPVSRYKAVAFKSWLSNSHAVSY